MHLLKFGLAAWLAVAAAAAPAAFADGTFDFSYSGRLTEGDSGKPIDGPVNLKFEFYHQQNGGSPVLSVTNGLTNITLQDGIFQITLSLSQSDYHSVFSDVTQPVFIAITDLTHAPDAPYDRQQVAMVPYAAKVPVDGKTVLYNHKGELTAAAAQAVGTAAGNVVALDQSARLPALDGSLLTNLNISAVGGQTAAAVAAAATQVAQASASSTANTLVLRDSAGVVNSKGVILASGSYGISLKAPSGLGVNTTYTLPAAPVAGQILSTDASGILAWTAAGAGAGSTVAKAGDTMTGVLNLPLNGLVVGTTQLVAANGNLGVGTTAPAAALHVVGNAVFGSGEGAAPAAATLRGAAGAGTNVVGANLTLAPANGTGTGASGSLVFQTAAAAASGPSADTLTDRMTIIPSGNIGIGTSAPLAALDVGHGAVSAGAYYVIQPGNICNYGSGPCYGLNWYDMTNLYGYNGIRLWTQNSQVTLGQANSELILGQGDGSSSARGMLLRGAATSGTNLAGEDLIIAAPNGTGTGGSGRLLFKTAPVAASSTSANTLATVLALTPAGNVGIGTTTPDNLLSVNGDADKPGGGSWGTFSDGRLKDIQGPFTYGLNEILDLSPLYYKYKVGNAMGLPSDKTYSGFVAQDVAKVIPEAVELNDRGYYKLNQDPILWAMLNALKEEHAQKEALAAEVAELRTFLCSRFADAPRCHK